MLTILSFAGLIAVIACGVKFVQLKQDGKSTKKIVPWGVASFLIMLLFMVLDPAKRLAAVLVLVSFVASLSSTGLLVVNLFKKRFSTKKLTAIVLAAIMAFIISVTMLNSDDPSPENGDQVQGIKGQKDEVHEVISENILT